MNSLPKAGHVTDNVRDLAQLTANEVRTQQFYMLPKINKTLTNPPGRPIIADVAGSIEKLSRLVSFWLQSSVCRLPSNIKDTTHMLKTLSEWNNNIGPFPDGTRLVTIEVISLYSNISHEEMLQAIRDNLESTQHTDRPPTQAIEDVADHILSQNFSTFQGKTFKQIHGTAMGTPMAPEAANLFIGFLETKLLQDSHVRITNELWKQFIEDILSLRLD